MFSVIITVISISITTTTTTTATGASIVAFVAVTFLLWYEQLSSPCTYPRLQHYEMICTDIVFRIALDDNITGCMALPHVKLYSVTSYSIRS